ncbi:hypothetical protein IFM89_029404 [Coptis chinensis]|uniref:Uncharacterized protein n=1 Tax=Coptis chinensis TaxID=261450 RepID=A0A835M7H7_9MAGN|nr:hypothetical protein IFM89_029404 [Coptis chinensis]
MKKERKSKGGSHSPQKQFPAINCSNSSCFLVNVIGTTTLNALSFSRNLSSETSFSNCGLSMKWFRISRSVVCEVTPNENTDAAARRARQAGKTQLHDKTKKSELKTRVKKVPGTP